jgi:exosortase
MSFLMRRGAGVCIAAAAVVSFALLFGPVLIRLVQDWRTDDNYSHGFLIVPLALYFSYQRLPALCRLAPRPSTFIGGSVIAVSLLSLVAGTLGSEFFLTRMALIGTMAGAGLFLLGAAHLRVLAFPLAFLILMVPLPAIVFNQIAFPMQLMASQFGEWIITLAGIPVFRDGNIIVLTSTTLEVAEACSGIRSLVSLLTVAVVLGYFSGASASVRTLIAGSSIPIAIVANAFRVAGTGVAAHVYGPTTAEGFFHTFSGWLLFATAFLMLIGVQMAITAIFPQPASVPGPAISLPCSIDS